ncbi:VOC family protein [Caenimonas soli]|uniref:VOC family protein n=1 Tax=Caenimonas soli TaxID=2735555 RepID=UPI001553F76C|nr:VOC family protein [Caenimonas soli]NPC55920.1 VOC family protein [Caenimonas soli]
MKTADPIDPVVRPRVLSHGTLEVYDLSATRRFYEEFLGLEVARHSSGAMVTRCGPSSHVVCIQSGDKLHPVTVMNHWGLDVESREAVDAAHAAALAHKDRYGIRNVRGTQFQHGVYSFYLEDLDHNWWEIQYYEGDETEDMFDFGDRFAPDGTPL